MDEIQLSSDLNVITAEINSYKQVAGQSIFEIGRRLKHVKENDLVHGEWEKWCSETVEITPAYANRYIKVFEEFKGSNQYTSIGLNKLYQIATLPKEEREKEHITSKGESKTIDEMTVRELQEVKRKLKNTEQAKRQAESQAETERKERERLERENEELANVEPERIEVIPDDYDFYKGNYESAVSLQKRYKKQMEEMREELNKTSVKGSDEENRLKEREKALKNKIKSIEKINDVRTHLDGVISQISTKTHSLDVDGLLNDYQVLDDFESTLNEVINVCNQLKDKLPNKNIIEGEIVNDQ